MTRKNNDKKLENDLIKLIQKHELYDLQLDNCTEWIYQELIEQDNLEKQLLIKKYLKNCFCLEIQIDTTYLIFIEIYGAQTQTMILENDKNSINELIDTILEIIDCNY